MSQAYQVTSVLGLNRTPHELRCMVRALKMHPWHNTNTETERLRCAEWALTHWHAYQAECDRRRDFIQNIRRGKQPCG